MLWVHKYLFHIIIQIAHVLYPLFYREYILQWRKKIEVSYKITKFGVDMGNKDTHTFLVTVEVGITFQKHQ